jgi:hypothetical protein
LREIASVLVMVDGKSLQNGTAEEKKEQEASQVVT